MSLLELAGTSGLALTGQPNNQEQRRGRCHDTILQPGHAMTWMDGSGHSEKVLESQS
jgi:hypothetical protein